MSSNMRVMTRTEVKNVLRGFIASLRIDPYDAGQVFERVGNEGIDSETLGDYLDGQGYPELATFMYEYGVAA